MGWVGVAVAAIAVPLALVQLVQTNRDVDNAAVASRDYSAWVDRTAARIEGAPGVAVVVTTSDDYEPAAAAISRLQPTTDVPWFLIVPAGSDSPLMKRMETMSASGSDVWHVSPLDEMPSGSVCVYVAVGAVRPCA